MNILLNNFGPFDNIIHFLNTLNCDFLRTCIDMICKHKWTFHLHNRCNFIEFSFSLLKIV